MTANQNKPVLIILSSSVLTMLCSSDSSQLKIFRQRQIHLYRLAHSKGASFSALSSFDYPQIKLGGKDQGVLLTIDLAERIQDHFSSGLLQLDLNHSDNLKSSENHVLKNIKNIHSTERSQKFNINLCSSEHIVKNTKRPNHPVFKFEKYFYKIFQAASVRVAESKIQSKIRFL